MAGLISTAEAPAIRDALGLFRVHTATITPRTDSGADDAWSNPVITDGTPVTAIPCKFRADDRVRLDEHGNLVIKAPTLTVAHDLSVSIGAVVTNVQNSEGVVLLAGPATVEYIVSSSGLGPALKKRLVLSGVEAQG